MIWDMRIGGFPSAGALIAVVGSKVIRRRIAGLVASAWIEGSGTVRRAISVYMARCWLARDVVV